MWERHGWLADAGERRTTRHNPCPACKPAIAEDDTLHRYCTCLGPICIQCLVWRPPTWVQTRWRGGASQACLASSWQSLMSLYDIAVFQGLKLTPCNAFNTTLIKVNSALWCSITLQYLMLFPHGEICRTILPFLWFLSFSLLFLCLSASFFYSLMALLFM